MSSLEWVIRFVCYGLLGYWGMMLCFKLVEARKSYVKRKCEEKTNGHE